MRILHVCPAAQLPTAPLPLSLQFLGHQVLRCTPETLPEPAAEVDVVIADASLDLSLAPTLVDDLREIGVEAPVIVVIGEGGLAAATVRWQACDIILPLAGPAEVEARLRLARDGRTQRLIPAEAAARFGGNPGVASAPGGSWAGSEATDPAVVVSGDLRIDEAAFTADLGARSLDLTYREFSLLKFFAVHPDRVFTRDEILAEVWGDDYYGGTRTVDVHVRRLRAKLGKDLENAINTVRNVGYRFSPDAADDEEGNA